MLQARVVHLLTLNQKTEAAAILSVTYPTKCPQKYTQADAFRATERSKPPKNRAQGAMRKQCLSQYCENAIRREADSTLKATHRGSYSYVKEGESRSLAKETGRGGKRKPARLDCQKCARIATQSTCVCYIDRRPEFVALFNDRVYDMNIEYF